jgi:hypothetical protein
MTVKMKLTADLYILLTAIDFQIQTNNAAGITTVLLQSLLV